MNWVDYVMLGVLAFFLLYGITRGFLRHVLGIAGVVAALIVAARWAPDLAGKGFFDGLRERNPRLPQMAAYISIFVAVAAGTGILVALLSRRAPRKELKATDTFLGMVLGALEGVLILGGVSIGLLEWEDPLAAPVKQSVLAPRLAEGCRALVLLIPEREREEIRGEFERGKKAVEESIPAPTPPPASAPWHADPPPAPPR